MPRPSVTEEQRTQMRSKIRAATLTVLRRHKLEPGDARGHEQVTIREVIDEAGISIGTFYKYFKNRRDLAQALWAEPVEKLRSELQADFASLQRPADKVRATLNHYVQFAMTERRIFRGAFLFVRPENDPKPKPLTLDEEVFYQSLIKAFEEGQKAGDFRDFDTHEMAQIFWAAIHGALALPINIDRYKFDPPETLTASMTTALLTLIEAR